MRKLLLYTALLGMVSFSCINRDVNPMDASTKKMYESIKAEDFDTIRINGTDYLIAERDRNNPHEGFGFMALADGNLKNRQDSILAYQKLNLQNQIRIISILEKRLPSDVAVEMEASLEYLLNKQ